MAAVHLGLEGYADKQRRQRQKMDDVMWNPAYCPNMYLVKGSLVYAKWKPVAPVDF